VRLELANEENEDAARGKETLHDVSPGRWLIMALDLEEQQ
jgi:sarcosine oxidase gamma subunit